jgi:RNA polymerase sigma-70 factor (ECF subfamily)
LSEQSNHIPSESDLIKGCLENDRQMQQFLYKIYAPKMYGVCLRYAGNVEDANDLLQEGFIKVYINLSKFRSEGSFEGWIRKIFVNTSIEHFRRKTQLYNITEAQENTIEDADINALNKLAVKDIIQLINELSPGYKTVFNLYVVEGYSHKEIAAMLGITIGTSKSQLARAKSVLKKSLEAINHETEKGNINS